MKPNILFLIIDSLRSDKFSQRAQLEDAAIHSFINNGIFFPETIASANGTILSWSSLFTSKFPFKTGIRSAKFNKLNDGIHTCFDVLENNGYAFYGYLPTLSETVGLFPKFKNQDCYYDFYLGITNGLGEKIISQINSKLDYPWFMLVHTMDLHQPVQVSNQFDDEKYGKNYYERKISEIDFWLKKVIDHVDLNTTIVIVTGDHGDYIKSIKTKNQELDFNPKQSSEVFKSKIANLTPEFLKPVKDKIFFLLENTNQAKKSEILQNLDLAPHEIRALMSGKADKDHFLFDELIKVPFLILGNHLPKNNIIKQQIRTVDIFPTLFDFLGFSFKSEVDGISLKSVIFDKNPKELPAYIESNPLVLKESNDVIGVRTSEFKYFRDKNNSEQRIHLFDLKNDPYEEKNIQETNQQKVKEMEQMLQELIKNTPHQFGQENDVESEEIARELRKLGYL
jgi:arylsulfatase A-like enzyme